MIARRELRAKVIRDPVNLLAFGLGAGLSPVAPGTVGSLLGLLLAFATVPAPQAIRFLLLAVLVLAGIGLCGACARRLGVHDHPGIVLDEIAGMYLVLLFVPLSIVLWPLAFGLFRLFDIWKPWPIRDLDHRLIGGLGIMLDDLMAALYAAFILECGGWLTSLIG